MLEKILNDETNQTVREEYKVAYIKELFSREENEEIKKLKEENQKLNWMLNYAVTNSNLISMIDPNKHERIKYIEWRYNNK